MNKRINFKDIRSNTFKLSIYLFLLLHYKTINYLEPGTSE